jgi:hypothetical protein
MICFRKAIFFSTTLGCFRPSRLMTKVTPRRVIPTALAI